MNYIFKMIKMLENNFNQIKATGTFIRWMLFLFLYKKGTRNYREFILPKIVILLLVGISLYFLSLEWPFISIMKTNNGSFWMKKDGNF